MNELTIPPKPEPLRILIVEDDPAAAAILEGTLSQTPHTTHTATSAEDGIKALNEEEPFDIILLDYHLPKMSGLQFCERIRNAYAPQKNPGIWVIAHTTETDYETVQNLLKAGANDYLPKPVRPDLLLLRVLSAQYNLTRTKALKLRITTLERMLAQTQAPTKP